MAEVGRPTDIDTLALKIRPLVLEGVSYVEIQKLLDISPNTWDTWVYKDFEGFRTNLNNWKKERMIKKAEKTIEELIYAEDDRVRLDASKFTLETLNKEEYSKRSELTGKDGEALTINVTSFDDRHTSPVHATELPARLLESAAEIQNRSIPPESGEIQISSERTDSQDAD